MLPGCVGVRGPSLAVAAIPDPEADMSNDLTRALALLTGCGLAWVGSATPALAQANIAVQYAFQDAGGTGTTVPTINNSTVTLDATAAATLGGTMAAFNAIAGSTDPSTANQVWETTSYPAAGTGSGTAGVRFRLPTTSAGGGFDNLFVRYDQRHSDMASQFTRFEYTTDGTTFVPLTTYQTTLNNVFFTRTHDLSGIAAANNNANFAIRVVSVFDPTAGNYTPTSAPGITYDPAGMIQYDMVTVSRGVNWVGGSGTGIGTAANYQGGVAPTATDTVAFGASANTTVNVDANTTLGQLAFKAGAPAYTFAAGGGTLTLNAGLLNNSTAIQTINAPVVFPAARALGNNGTLVFGGSLTMTGNTNLQLTGPGTTAINGTYTGNDINLTGGHTLGGIGTISNEVQTFSGKIRGGVSDGTNNFGTLTVSVAGDLELYLAPGNRAPALVVEATRTGVGTANNSRIALVGGTGTDLELNNAAVGGPNRFNIELLATNLTVGETYALTILTTDSTGSIEFEGAQQPNGAIIDAASYSLISPNYAFTGVQLQVVDVAAGSTLVLSFTPVPEPTGVLFTCAAAAAGAAWLRRRRAKAG
jgi:hypothetical protein